MKDIGDAPSGPFREFPFQSGDRDLTPLSEVKCMGVTDLEPPPPSAVPCSRNGGRRRFSISSPCLVPGQEVSP